MTEYNEPSFPGVFREVEYQDPKTILKKLLQELSTWQYGLKVILNRGISFDDNVDVRRISVTSHATPGTEFSVAHTLGKVPTGYIIYSRDGAGTVYDGTTSNTPTTLYLKSDASSTTFGLIVF